MQGMINVDGSNLTRGVKYFENCV